MASGIIGNDVPRKGLRVRVPCPPLFIYRSPDGGCPITAHPIRSSPRVGKPRGGGIAMVLANWSRSRLHAGEPHGGLLCFIDSPSGVRGKDPGGVISANPLLAMKLGFQWHKAIGGPSNPTSIAKPLDVPPNIGSEKLGQALRFDRCSSESATSSREAIDSTAILASKGHLRLRNAYA